jgi:hypothetical protein
MKTNPLELLGVATIRKGVHQGVEATLWSGDKRYLDTPQLTPGTELVLADIEGPAVITLLRIAKMPEHVFRDPAQYTALNRAIVLEITFDDADEPAVMCPVADFFADGCNGAAKDFSTPFVEVVPSAYNSYFPMPFAKRAKVVVRNDSADLTWSSYYVVEWQKLPEWDPGTGYFHATWKRQGFYLTDETRLSFLDLNGSGHVIGRQFSVVTDEPKYTNFGFVMEGNNEVDVDGRKRALEWLGSEDSFTFSWGFHRQFLGLRAGMPYVDTEEHREARSMGAPASKSRLSIYRFHDHMPVRFDKSLTWWICWQNETFGKQRGWVDYATVFYWYQDSPAGYTHEPLPPTAMRCCDILPEG